RRPRERANRRQLRVGRPISGRHAGWEAVPLTPPRTGVRCRPRRGGKAPPRAASPHPHSPTRGVGPVIFIRLPAWGKTTFYRACFAQTHAHVSKDNFPNNRNPERRQRELIEQAFAEGRPVVVDNTNATAEARRPLLALAQAHNVPVVGYYFASS